MACGCKKKKAGAATSGCVGPNCAKTTVAKTKAKPSIKTQITSASAIARRQRVATKTKK